MADIGALRKQMIDAAKKKITQKYEDRDVHIIKSVNILEDIDPIANLLIEQLREWHSVHFPELSEMVKEGSTYVKLVSSIGPREGFTEKKIGMHIDDRDFAREIAKAAENSIGSSASEKDITEMKSLAQNCLNLIQEREHLSKYLEQTMMQELPNFTEIAGPVLGAKILAKIGSKKSLAFAPASTIQMIGAEKALFMHFRKGVNGPKYGYLFQHPLVKAAKDVHKGRIARSVASKLAIAAKKDYFGNRSSADDLKKKLDERVEALGKIVNERVHAPQASQREPMPRREYMSSGQRREFSDQRPQKEFTPAPRVQSAEGEHRTFATSYGQAHERPRGGYDNSRPVHRSGGAGFGRRTEFRPPYNKPREGARAGFGGRREYGSKPAYSHAESRPKSDGFHYSKRPEGSAKFGEGTRAYPARDSEGTADKGSFSAGERKPFNKDSHHKRPFGGNRRGGRNQGGSRRGR